MLTSAASINLCNLAQIVLRPFKSQQEALLCVNMWKSV